MDFDLSNVLKAIGPTASIVFAAWIFMGFLQQRYDTAVARYQDMIEAFGRASCQTNAVATLRTRS